MVMVVVVVVVVVCALLALLVCLGLRTVPELVLATCFSSVPLFARSCSCSRFLCSPVSCVFASCARGLRLVRVRVLGLVGVCFLWLFRVYFFGVGSRPGTSSYSRT